MTALLAGALPVLACAGERLAGAQSKPAAAGTVAPGAAVAAAGGGKIHHAQGVVVEVDAGSLLIRHGPIESAGMGPMTMEFRAPASGVPASLRLGAKVRFAFRDAGGGEFALVSIEASK